MKKINFNSKTAVVVCHDIVHGIPHEVRDYLILKRTKRVLFISHPYQTANNPIKASSYSLFESGTLKKRGSFGCPPLPEYIAYIKDSFLTFLWSVCILRGTIDYFIGAGNLNAFCGIVLIRLGIVKNSIYYVIDYVPNRFGNTFVNTVYHHLEKACALYATVSWNLTSRMIKAREEKWGSTFPNQKVVPHGVHLDLRPHRADTSFDPYNLIYLGFLTQEQGVQLAISALRGLSLKFKKIRLTIIGSGPYEGELKKLTKKFGVQSRVHFLGFSDDQKHIIHTLSRCALGLALYSSDHPFSFYADQSKIKQYLLAGIPVVTTKLPYIAEELVRKGCGVVLPYDKGILISVLSSLLKNKKKLMRMHLLARHMAEPYNWNTLFDTAFQSL